MSNNIWLSFTDPLYLCPQSPQSQTNINYKHWLISDERFKRQSHVGWVVLMGSGSPVQESIEKHISTGWLDAAVTKVEKFRRLYVTELNCRRWHSIRSMSVWKQLCVVVFASYNLLFGRQSNFDHYLQGFHEMYCNISWKALRTLQSHTIIITNNNVRWYK